MKNRLIFFAENLSFSFEKLAFPDINNSMQIQIEEHLYDLIYAIDRKKFKKIDFYIIFF